AVAVAAGVELRNLRRWLKHVARVRGVLIAHQYFIPAAGPGKVGPHAAGCVGLDHRVNARGFERALRHIRLRLATECVNDNKISVSHPSILRPMGSAYSRPPFLTPLRRICDTGLSFL